VVKRKAEKLEKTKVRKLEKANSEDESKPDDFEELFKQLEAKKFFGALGEETDLTMIVLRAHLYIENLLERIVLAKLRRGDKVIEGGNFTFNQKLIIVDALGCLPDNVISTVRALNKLRNQCSHELGKNIQMGDITRVGSPLGKVFSGIKRITKFDERKTLTQVLSFTVGYLARTCFSAEHE
jgi:hypothetical protein